MKLCKFHSIFGAKCSSDNSLNIFCNEGLVINPSKDSQRSCLIEPNDFYRVVQCTTMSANAQ